MLCFARSGRSGFYLAVVDEGDVGAGDPMELISREPECLTVAEVLQAHGHREGSLLERASRLPALSAEWRQLFRDRVAKLRS